jgi:hypothetical protein
VQTGIAVKQPKNVEGTGTYHRAVLSSNRSEPSRLLYAADLEHSPSPLALAPPLALVFSLASEAAAEEESVRERPKSFL